MDYNMVLTNLLKSLDGYKIIRKGEDFILKKMENKQEPPRSWEEFCKKYPVKSTEAFISSSSHIHIRAFDTDRQEVTGRNWCYSKEEAEAFLALMQLRQLRKVWVGDWAQSKENSCAGIFYSVSHDEFTVSCAKFWNNIVLSFPTKIMAEDFLGCFRDLCEKAKILL